ncbi:hypothetical protein N836_24035 [Leptolyngbya sp. Heron Island J]|uniref:COP23 domain-containing protein n=1 Tax=Leptolyngbya sp. Heron Island J TaxID=1385935 RepID=UPI0003B948CA|nr:COP23 domain-containing protein [Leptolyngbya sp. Heron Island J]ESA32860.1 hypothetical protein N836_24035 [Leptolyngbya sp. Heron Island J]
MAENEISSTSVADDSSITFYCGTSRESQSATPATIIDSPLGTYTVVQWTKEFYPETNETPIERCLSVSSVFQNYYKQDLLSDISSEEFRDTTAICTSDSSRASCARVIFLLDEGENGQEIAEALQGALRILFSSDTSVSPDRELIAWYLERVNGIGPNSTRRRFPIYREAPEGIPQRRLSGGTR